MTKQQKYIKKRRSKYQKMGIQSVQPKVRKRPSTIKGMQSKANQLNRAAARKTSTITQFAKNQLKQQQISRDIQAWRDWRIPQIKRELQDLETKDRSRRRGKNKNQWTEADVRKYGKLKAELNQLIGQGTDESWKTSIDVSQEVGKKNYTEGQKNYIRALKVIEAKISKSAEAIKMMYGSDDIEELANQYYAPELSSYSQKELDEIEEEFNKTHGYHIRIKQGSNPFADIDFNTLQPN